MRMEVLLLPQVGTGIWLPTVTLTGANTAKATFKAPSSLMLIPLLHSRLR